MGELPKEETTKITLKEYQEQKEVRGSTSKEGQVVRKDTTSKKIDYT